MTDYYMKELDGLSSEKEDSLKNIQQGQKSSARDRYACMHLQNSLEFINLKQRFGKELHSRKASAQCIGSSILGQNYSMLTDSTNRTSNLSTLRSNKFHFASDQDSINCFTEQIGSIQGSATYNDLDNITNNSVIHQQDNLFKNLIQTKLNSNSQFSERYSIYKPLIRESRKDLNRKQKRFKNQSLAFYDSNSNISSHSDKSNGRDYQDDQQIISLNHIPTQKEINPPLPQTEIKSKQRRSQSVIASKKLPLINRQTQSKIEQTIFNQRKKFITDAIINNNSSFISSAASLQERILEEKTQFSSPQKFRSQKFITPKGNKLQKQNNPILKIDGNNSIVQEFFKLISQKEHFQYIRMDRKQIKDYISTIYDSHSAEVLLNFVGYNQLLSFQSFLNQTQVFASASNLELCLFAFLLYDTNNDGYICNNDIFNRWKHSNNLMGQEDQNEIIRYSQNQLNKREQAKQTLLLLRDKPKQDEKNQFLSISTKDEDSLELENKIISGKKQISLERYRELKQKGESSLPEVHSRQYTWYTKCPQIQEHYSHIRIIRDEISSFEDVEKKQTAKKISYNKISGDFILNFNHFYEIFRSNPPRIVYDMIASLSGYLFSHVNYPYTQNVLLQKNIQTVTQERGSNKINAQELSEESNFLKQIKSRQSMECQRLQFSFMLTDQ